MPSRSTSLRLPALRVFIVFPLLPCCLPGAEGPHDDLSSLRGGMVRVVEDARKKVAKDRQEILERHAMLLAVGGSLPRIPLEAQFHWMARNLSRPPLASTG